MPEAEMNLKETGYQYPEPPEPWYNQAMIWLVGKLPRVWLVKALCGTHDFYVIALFKHTKVTRAGGDQYYYEADGNVSFKCSPFQCKIILEELSKKVAVEDLLSAIQKEKTAK